MRHCSVLLSVILFTGFFLFSVHAQAIDLTGTVKDASTKAAILGAKVSLTLHPEVFATTDAAGAYHLQNVNVRFLRSITNELIKTPYFIQNSLFFGISKDGEQAVIELYSLSGRRVASLVNTRLGRGNYRIDPFAASFASQVFFVKVRTDSRTAMFKMPFVSKLSAVSGGTLHKINGADARNFAAKSAAVKDTIEVLAQGHKMGIIPITAYTGVNNIELAVQGPFAGMIGLNATQFTGIIRDTMVVFVLDSNVIDPTLPVRVWSASDTKGFTIALNRAKDPYAGIVYQGWLTFSLSKSDSTKKVLKVAHTDSVYASYADASPAATLTSSGQWLGSPALVHPGPSLYLGIRDSMQIMLYDNDLIDSTTEVTAKSSNADTAGIPLTLRRVSPGTYQSDKTGFTLGQSVPYKRLQVADNGSGDKIVFWYNDPPFGAKTDYVIWKGIIGTISLDCDLEIGYVGTTNKMDVTLTDPDILIDSAVVHIASKKDPTGINVKVTGAGDGVFDGLVQFSTTASALGVIAVQNPDTITVSYNDAAPKMVVTQQVPWHQ